MKSRDLGLVLLRIFAIYLFVMSWSYFTQTVSFFNLYFSQSFPGTENGQFPFLAVIMQFLTLAFFLQMGLYVFFRPHRIIDRALDYRKKETETQTGNEATISKDDLMAIGLVLVGIYILSGAIPSVFSEISMMIRSQAGIPTLYFDRFDPKTWLFIFDIAGKVIYLFLGLLLVFGPSGLRKLFSRTAKDISKSIKKIRRD